MTEASRPLYRGIEEVWHAITHGIGAVLSIAGLAILVGNAVLRGDAWDIAGCSVFAAALILMFTASTLYHSIPDPRAKQIFKQIDHSAIYILIAGTYTPILLSFFRESFGWWMLAVLWSLVALGLVLETFFKGRFEKLGLAIHLGMGWAIVFVAKPMLEVVPNGALWLLLAGGLAYTVGVIFYVWKTLPFNHVIWHFFVLAGAVLHYLAILLYVIP